MAGRDIHKYGGAIVSVAFAIFLLIVFCLGGSSRADAGFQIIVRLASIAMLAVGLFFVTREDFHRVRVPLLVLGALAGLMLLQLIPLPPFLWEMLPGRRLFAASADLAGVAQPWRPISLAPDATVNSVLSTLPGFAALVGLALFPRRYYLFLLVGVVAMAMISGIIGVLQISSGEGYFFSITNRGSSVGFFANRNHHAALLTAVIPMLAAITVYPSERFAQFRLPMACALALFLAPMILITGSRAGLLLLMVGAVGAVVLARWAWRGAPRIMETWRVMLASRLGRAGVIAFGVMALGVVAATVLLSRALAIQRLFSQDIEADTRLRMFDTMVGMVETYFPFGSGFGSFPAVFKIVEPDWYLGPSYFNHAHNDVLEILIEGGLPSALIALAFLVWAVRVALRIWRPGLKIEASVLLARLGSIQVLMLILASIADYPLRTPLNQVLFVLGLGFMAFASARPAKAGGRRGVSRAVETA